MNEWMNYFIAFRVGWICSTVHGSIVQREVRCTKDDTDHVDDFWCRMLSKPDTIRTCPVPCPEDCRVSDWSEWSQCSSATDEDAIQSRIRVVLEPPMHRGSACPPLVEKRSCLDWLVQQDRIRWHLGPWSVCQLPPSSVCGIGITIRSINSTFLLPSKLMNQFNCSAINSKYININ